MIPMFVFGPLNKKYGDIEAVHDHNLEVYDEEFVVFLGPSGCGKSRAQMRFEIARIHKDLKTTAVYVTHDQMEALTLAEFKNHSASTESITIQGKAELSEFHGDNYLVNMPVGNSGISVFLPTDRRSDESNDLKLGIQETTLHLFDDKTRKNLLREAD